MAAWGSNNQNLKQTPCNRLRNATDGRTNFDFMSSAELKIMQYMVYLLKDFFSSAELTNKYIANGCKHKNVRKGAVVSYCNEPYSSLHILVIVHNFIGSLYSIFDATYKNK